MNFLDEPNDDEEKELYVLNRHDNVIIHAAMDLLRKVVGSTAITPSQLVGVTKVLHALSRLPQITDNVTVSIDLTGPRRIFGDHEIYHYWNISVNEEGVEISAGGHFYRKSTGGDSFSTMQWSANPGSETNFSDYLDSLGIVDDAAPFEHEVKGIDLSKDEYKLEVADDDMPEDDDESDDDGSGVQQGESLALLSDTNEGRRRNMVHSDPPTDCDLCKCRLDDGSFFVDGAMNRRLEWANMCERCFFVHGAGIGWGKGQLYSKQPNGNWLLTGGFPPEGSALESEDSERIAKARRELAALEDELRRLLQDKQTTQDGSESTEG